MDRGHGDCERQLEQWRRRILATPPHDDLVAIAWADARLRYQVPVRYAEQLIEGVARDLTQTRYQTFDELTAYCYGVASTVGLMSMHVIGYAGPHAIPYAIKLGVALQLTNIFRDVGDDWQAGRLYLPQEDLDSFGLTAADITRGQVTEAWRALCAIKLPGIGCYMPKPRRALPCLNRRGALPLPPPRNSIKEFCKTLKHTTMMSLPPPRPYVTKWGKVRRLPGIWWRSRTVGRSR